MLSNFQAEILVDVPEAAVYETWVSCWFTLFLTGLAERSESDPATEITLVKNSLEMGGKPQKRKLSPKNLEWLCQGALDGHTVSCRLNSASDHGMADVRGFLDFTVWRDDGDKRWAQFRIEGPEEYLLRPGSQQWLLSILLDLADLTNPVFGWIGYGGDGECTEFEHSMRGYGVWESYPRSRRFLRGYDWLTIIPAEIVESLGGRDALVRETVAEAGQLSGGGIWLRATEDFFDYDDGCAFQLFELVARVLQPGMPELRPQHGADPKRTPVILRDAAEYGATSEI